MKKRETNVVLKWIKFISECLINKRLQCNSLFESIFLKYYADVICVSSFYFHTVMHKEIFLEYDITTSLGK